MKTIWSTAFLILSVLIAKGQQKLPVLVEGVHPAVLSPFGAYYDDHSGQGRAMYINNSQFYNKDNLISNPVPEGNGFYTQPGYGNPVNRPAGEESLSPPVIPGPQIIIYEGYIPVRQTGANGDTDVMQNR